jgi:hypothetical protein
LPITALREHPPISAAIWLALRPSAHSRFRSSTRSSVQVIAASIIHGLLLVSRHPRGPESLVERGRKPARASSETKLEMTIAARDIVLDVRQATRRVDSGARVEPSALPFSPALAAPSFTVVDGSSRIILN